MRLSPAWIALGITALVACGGAPSRPNATTQPTAKVAEADDRAQLSFPQTHVPGFPAEGWAGIRVAPGEAIPVTPADPMWGNPDAPVTIVEFADLECPYCARAAVTVAELRKIYGPDKLRIVWKNDPLPRHEHARQAADLGAGIFAAGGNEAFFTYVETLYAGLLDSSEGTEFMTLAVGSAARAAESTQGRLSGPAMMAAARGPGSEKVDADLALSDALGVSGTPAFYVNGVLISGAQPVEVFRAAIDDELRLANASARSGTPSESLYAARLAENVKAGKSEREGARPRGHAAPPDTTVWNVPVGASPVLGKATAPVTIVEFADFQCSYCKKASATIEALRARYGDKLRVVFKHNPLSFHEHADPAAELAIEVFKKKGNDAFWKAHDALFAADEQDLDEKGLSTVAKSLGLDPPSAMAAVKAKKHQKEIDADQDLADDVEANGTPCFFINGRKLAGAQPADKFAELIDAQLAVAEAKIASGTPAATVYAALMKDAKGAPPPETKTAPKVSSQSPARGAASAKVTLQVFSDFQCPFCKKVEPTLTELEGAFPGKLRIVWRNRPLSMHENAEPAAEAALEARKQKGDAGFWKMHDLLFSDQDALDRAGLEAKAQKLGLDMASFRNALDTSSHKAEIDADAKVADALGINGTPGVLVNDYFIEGAESLSKFKRVVRLALEGKKK